MEAEEEVEIFSSVFLPYFSLFKANFLHRKRAAAETTKSTKVLKTGTLTKQATIQLLLAVVVVLLVVMFLFVDVERASESGFLKEEEITTDSQ